MREGSFFSEFRARDFLHPVKYTRKQIRRRTTKLGLMPGKFNYDKPDWKWGGRYINKNNPTQNNIVPQEGMSSPEFLETGLRWRTRRANNNPPDRANALLEQETALRTEWETKLRNASYLKRIYYTIKGRDK